MRMPMCTIAVVALLAAGSAAGVDVPRPKMRLHLGVEPPVTPGKVVAVEIRLLDDAGAAIDAPADAPVFLDVDIGKATSPVRAERGVYRSTLTVPRRLPSTRTLLVLARSGQSSVERSLELSPGPAAAIHVQGPPVCAEDTEGCAIDVSAEDADGNPAAEIPFGKASRGTVLPAGWAEAGRWVLVYRPPRVDRELADAVAIELGAQRAGHELRVTPSRARFTVAPLAGYARQGSRSGFAVTAQAIGTRQVGGGWVVGAGLELNWWSASHSARASGLKVSADRSQLGGALLVLVERRLVGPLTGTVLLGGGAVRVATTNHVEGQPGVDDSGWAPTAEAAVALGWRFRLLTPMIEVRQAWVGDAHLLTDPGAQWPLLVQAGFRLDVR